MNPSMTYALMGGLVGLAVIGAPLGWALHVWVAGRKVGSARRQAEEITERAQKEAEKKAAERLREAKEEIDSERKRVDSELGKRRDEMERQEKKFARREEALDKKFDALDRREDSLAQKEKQAEKRAAELEEMHRQAAERLDDITRRCEEVSGMTAEEARQVLMNNLENEVRQDAASMIRRMESEARETSAKKARQIITLAIQKYAAEQVSESTISVVNLPSDEVKGRIIGREGRNIRALEAATGCNFIVDDTPEAVVLSCFDPLRREIARVTLEKLLGDGRIHPGRIEDITKKTEKEIFENLRELGEQTAFDLGIHGLHPELIKLLGRLKYRTSYGQNVLKHSIEVANVAKIMASELQVDEQMAKRAGLLHDIGKAVSYEMEGTHANIGAELAKKYGEAPGICHAIAAHHAEEEPRTIVAVLVQAADAISAARPGARRETLETYIKRLENLESIADSFDGVAKSYAIQAGREIRILVDPKRIDDDAAAVLAREVTKKIESDMQYPGQIRVTVLREVRSVEYAK